MAEPTVQLEISGGGDSASGDIEGSGELMIEIGDLAKAGLSVDYSQKDKIVFGIDAQTTLTVRSKGDLTFAGKATYRLDQKTFSAGASMKFEIDKNSAVKIQVNSKDGQVSGKATISVRFG